MLQGQKDLITVGRHILSELAPVVGVHQALFYTFRASREDEAGSSGSRLTLLASYASEGAPDSYEPGEGLIGQCAVDKAPLLLQDLPEDYVRIRSGLGGAAPRNVLVLPVLFEGQVKGVLELATLDRFSKIHEDFLEQLMETIGIVLNTIEANMRTEDLLKQSQSLAGELQSRQEELQKTNQELEEKAKLLADRNVEVERKNQEIEHARKALEEKAEQLALTSKYKSEFLANMSHELRTPLNSLLILSDQLSKNTDGNLTPKQTEFSKTIHSSGNDLLNLINDILDLSKIESGTVQVDLSELRLGDLRSFVERTFRHVAEAKNVEFAVEFDRKLPETMLTDAKRLQQIIKNLLSNAFKFTHHGRVSLLVHAADAGWSDSNDDLNRADGVLAFDVRDTGIGIPPDKQQIIFEAFQQADGSTSRKYGGTGLGLAISRELSRLLGGEIRLVSRPGSGSTFTLYVPRNYTPPRTPRKPLAATPPVALAPAAEKPRKRTSKRVAGGKSNGHSRLPAPPEPPQEVSLINEVDDDRDQIRAGDRVLLIVENDMAFARLLLEVAREHGMKGLVTSLGAAALVLARDYKPHAVTLDIFLPDIEGWRVLERLKSDLAARHTPVCVISTEEARARSLASGAVAFVAKPIQSRDVLDGVFDYLGDFISRPKRHVVVVEPDEARRKEICELVGAEGVEISTPDGGRAAASLLGQKKADCVVVHPGETALAEELSAAQPQAGRGLSQLPVLVYGTETAEAGVWNRLADRCTLRRVDSRERLLDLTMLFTHRTVGELPADKQQMLVDLHDSDKILASKKVLIVDDDMRNIFALATVLEEHAMETISADNGRDAIRLLQTEPDIDVVLMDIMMPELDGMETIREIRRDPKLRNLPIVAVTAKAMKGDREKCIEAGAWDYLSKPVDTEQLLAVLRAWLHA